MNESPFIERRLTALEIHDRRLNVESLLDEKDRLDDEIDEQKRTIKDNKVEIDRIEFRVRELRKEIRQGFVLEPRQIGMSFVGSAPLRNDGPTLSDRDGNPVDDPREAPITSPAQRGKCGLCGRFGQLEFYETGLTMVCLGGCPEGIDASTDEPAEEIDPPGPDAFAARYPMATDHGKLRGDLAVVLGNRGLRVPSLDELRQWHERSGVFDALAHWARLEIAHMNAAEHPELQIPGRLDMPEKLAELLGERPKKRRTRAPKETT